MPPVFGPVSPSPMRLKSCAGASGTTPTPVGTARTPTPPRPRAAPRSRSGPGRPRPRADPSSSCVHRLADEDALAGRQPVDLDDARRPRDRERLGRRDARRSQHILGELFEPSIRAAARPGPKTATPFRRRTSATPATSGASGPTRRGRRRGAREPEQALAVVGPNGVAVAELRRSRDCPARRAARSSTGACASFHASACSRPPDPTRSTFTAAESTPRVRTRPSPGGRGGDAGERVDHVRVELRPRAAPQLLERLLGASARAVGPVGRHRAVGVAAADDPRDERDLLADEPVGIAAAVQALVARADEVRRRCRARRRRGRASPRRRPCASRRSRAPRA